MEEQINYYMELELDENLSSEELAKQLKAIIRKWRNRTNAPDQDVRHKAEKMMEMAEEAIGILTDPAKKTEYDKNLSEQTRILEQNNFEPKPTENNQVEYERIFEKANQFKKIGDSNETMILAKQLIDMDTSDWRGWELAGRVYYESKNEELAKNYYQKAIELEKNIPAYVYYNLGLAQNALGKKVEAFNSFIRSLDISPNYDLPLKKCNDLLEYMNMDSVLSFFEKLKDKRNDSLAYETLAKAYSLKADRMVQNIEGSPIFTSKEQIHEYIELMEEAGSYSEKPEINHKIVKAKHALGKEFDRSKFPVLLFPLLNVLSILIVGEWFMLTILYFLLSAIILVVIVDASIRPRFEINKWNMDRKGTLYDKLVDLTYVKKSKGWTIGIWFVIIFILSPITGPFYVGLAIYLVFNKFSPQIIKKKESKMVEVGKNGDQ